VLEGDFYKLAYLMSRHYVFGNNLSRWAVIVVGLTLGIVIWRATKVLVLALVLAVMTGLIVAFVLARARRRRYIRFEFLSAALDHPVTPRMLPPDRRVHVRATGHFEVNKRRRHFVEAMAQFQTFETRERMVMVNIRGSSLLRLAHSPRREVGWWYTFFQPELIGQIELGRLHFGHAFRPALKISVRSAGGAEPEVLFLSFDDEVARALVLADLKVDAVAGHVEPGSDYASSQRSSELPGTGSGIGTNL
jgi:hypothetical protein